MKAIWPDTHLFIRRPRSGRLWPASFSPPHRVSMPPTLCVRGFHRLCILLDLIIIIKQHPFLPWQRWVKWKCRRRLAESLNEENAFNLQTLEIQKNMKIYIEQQNGSLQETTTTKKNTWRHAYTWGSSTNCEDWHGILRSNHTERGTKDPLRSKGVEKGPLLELQRRTRNHRLVHSRMN